MQPFDQKGDIDEESMKINLESAKLADDLLSNMLSQTHLINDDIYQVFIKKTQLDVIVQAQDILRKTQIENKRLTFDEVSQLFASFEELKLTDELVYSSSKLAEAFRAQKAWREEIEILLKSDIKVTLQDLKKELRNLRQIHNKNGIVLVQSRINHLKKIFCNKRPLADLQVLLEKDKANSHFDNTEYMLKLNQYQEEAGLFNTQENSLLTLRSQEKPIQYLKHVLT